MDPKKALSDLRGLSRAYGEDPRMLTAEECASILQDMVEAFDALDGWMTSGGYSPWDRS